MGILRSGVLVSFLVAFALTTTFTSNAVTCSTVTTSRGVMTAAVVGAGTVVGVIDATGCDIGVYIAAGTVTITATVHDANQFGIFNDGATVTVTGSTISNTGHHTGTIFEPNGVQTGIGVLFAEGSSGSISGNTINNYQKGGVVVDACNPLKRPSCTVTLPTSVGIENNVVTGLGPVHFIAQNGIQVSRRAVASTFAGNVVSDNIYTQNTFGSDTPNHVGSSTGVVSTGILFFQAGGDPKTGTIASSNHAFRNQANVTVIR